MTRKDKLYIAGTIFCFATAGFWFSMKSEQIKLKMKDSLRLNKKQFVRPSSQTSCSESA